jgi:hypothetical protein
MKVVKSSQHGFVHHILIAVVAVFSIGVIGAVFLELSNAQTTACTARTFSLGAKDSSSSHCVQNIQQMFNGMISYIDLQEAGSKVINSAPLTLITNKYAFFSVNSSFGKTSNVYDSQTVGWVSSYQRWVNSATAAAVNKVFGMSSATFANTFRPKGTLPTNGTTEAKTWYADCQFVNHIPAAARTTNASTDYTGGKPNSAGTNKTNMWYIRSYMRAAYSASSSAGCAVILQNNPTPGPTSGSKPATPTGVTVPHTTTNSFSIAWTPTSGATSYVVYVTYQGAVLDKHTVSSASATITGLTADHTYTIHVAAQNSHGESAATNGPTARTLT